MKKAMFFTLLFLLSLVVVLGTTTLPKFSLSLAQDENQAEDKCRDILINGTQNKLNLHSKSELESFFLNALCSYEQGKTESSTNTGGNILDLIKGDYNTAHLQELKKIYCGSNQSKIKSTDLIWLSSSITSNKIVESWANCIETQNQGKIGLQSSIEGTGKTVFFKVRWVPRLNVNYVKVDSFIICGGSFAGDPILKPGTPINSEEISQPIFRNSNEQLSIVLNVIDPDKLLYLGSTAKQLKPNTKTVDVKITWDFGDKMEKGAVYLNICDNPFFNKDSFSELCANINVANENTQQTKGTRIIRLSEDTEYRICLVADNLPNKPERWVAAKIITAKNQLTIPFTIADLKKK